MGKVWLPVLLQRHGWCVDKECLLLHLESLTSEHIFRSTVSLCQRCYTLFIEIPARILDGSAFPHTIDNLKKKTFFLTRSTITYRQRAYTETKVAYMSFDYLGL